jgi:hypothetical protein
MNGKAGRTSSRRDLRLGASERGHERLQAADMEGLAFDRARLDEPPLGRVERVEARGEQRVQGGRQRAVLAALAHVGRELLEEERVAARPRHHTCEGRLGQRRPRAEQAAAGLLVQRGRPQDGPRRPRGSRVEQLGAPDAQQQDGRGQRAAGELVDEVEQRRLGPVRVLEGQHERPVGGQRREEHPEGPGRRVGRGHTAQPQDRRDRRRGRAPIVGRGHDRAQRAALQGLEHHLAQRPVGHPVAVGGAVADQHLRVSRRVARELAHEPRLADPRLAGEGHELDAARPAHARHGGVQRGQLALAAGKRGHVGAPGADRVEQRLHRLAQAQLADVGLARQPRSGSHDVAGRQRVVAGDEGDPCGHAQTDVQRDGLPLQLAYPALQGRGGPNRAQRVVLVTGPGAEDGHEAVGKPFDHRVAMAPQHALGLIA